MSSPNGSEGEYVPDGRQRLLDAAVRLLETHGEAALRMTAIAEEAGVAVALITHHFGSRDGLVVAAQQARVVGDAVSDLAVIDAIVSGVTSREELRERLAGLTSVLVSGRREATRLSRIAALASAHGRPEAEAALGATIGELLDGFAALIARGQERGLIRTDVDARSLATFINAYALGLVVADLDPHRADADALRDVIGRAFDVFLTDPGTSAR
jgi:AcrR family transcriptional regulator